MRLGVNKSGEFVHGGQGNAPDVNKNGEFVHGRRGGEARHEQRRFCSRESGRVDGQTRGRPWPREREGPAPSGVGGMERSGRFAGHPNPDRERDAIVVGVKVASWQGMQGNQALTGTRRRCRCGERCVVAGNCRVLGETRRRRSCGGGERCIVGVRSAS